jgi:hypothetical protein
MGNYNLENLTPDEKEKLFEYVASLKEIKKEIKKLLVKKKLGGIKTEEEMENPNRSSGLTLNI